MSSTKEYLDFVLEQLSELDEISCKAMMGEYILYYRGRIFGGIYDDRLLVKSVPAAVKLMPDAKRELPYDGAMPQKRETADDRQRGGVCAGCLPLFSFSEYLYSLEGVKI